MAAYTWTPVLVVSTKWNGQSHRSTPSMELGSDEFGRWVWMPPGTIAETPSGPFQATPGLRLLPVGQMWSAYFVPSSPPGPQPESIYVDITTPVQQVGDVFEFIDLDLDVEVIGAGPATVLDRDEFNDHARAWKYPAELKRTAESACSRVAAALEAREAPFDGTYLTWWWRCA